MDRPASLRKLLDSLEFQEPKPDGIIVVDNGGRSETQAIVAASSAIHLKSNRNLGGAGGFVHGIMHALALGCDRVWLMDDDGFPETSDCLAELSRAMTTREQDMVSPLIVDIEDPSRLAFFYYRNGQPLKLRAQLKPNEVIPQFAHLFNGALIRADAFQRFGLPRYELFFRGDEVDFMFRLNRGGASFSTVSSVAFCHPSGATDTVPIMQGRYHAVAPKSLLARFYYYRNRGNLFREFSLWHLLVYDIIRYSWFFGVTRSGDRAGFSAWARALWSGWSRNLPTYAQATSNDDENRTQFVDNGGRTGRDTRVSDKTLAISLSPSEPPGRRET